MSHMGEYELAPSPPGMLLSHLNGVPWHEAPLPRRLHRCWPQTRVFLHLRRVDRCACGATRLDDHGLWIDKNETRKARARE